MPWNVPDDWNQYYYSCGCHASEGGCSCPRAAEDSERPWLEESGYDYDGYETWEKLISFSTHTCRRDHSDGKIKKGERYKVCLLYTSPSPRDVEESRMPSSA